MRVKFTVLLLLLLISASFVSAQVLDEEYFEANREVYFKFKLDNKSAISALSKEISIDNFEDGYVYAFANQWEFNEFVTKGIEFEILTRPGVKDFVKMAGSVEEAKEWDSYPTYEDYVSMMYQFATDYPDLCRIVDAGNTVENRKILFAIISDNVNQREAEPQVMYSGTMHGDETTGYVLLLRLIDYLLTNYGTDDEVNNLVNNLEIWINPAANPDGTYNSGNHTVNGATRSNANGYDLNRNFPDPEDGTHPTGTWQPETIIMMEVAQQNHFVLSANFHGGIEVMNYPWDTYSARHPDDAWLQIVSREYADNVHVHNSNYMTAYNNGITNGYDWYSVAGGRQDYYTYFHRGREITIELSDTKLLSASQLPAHWDWNKQALLDYLKQATYGINGIVTSSLGDPIKATIEIVGHDHTNSQIWSDSLTGRYVRMINAGTYDLTFTAEDHFSKTITGISIADEEYISLDVTLISQFGTPDDVAPDQITDAQLTEQTSNSLKFSWTVPNDTSAGGVVGYDIRYSTTAINSDDDFNAATQIQFGGQPSAIGETENITVDGLLPDTDYYFAVKAHDIWNNYSVLSNVVTMSTYMAPVLSLNKEAITHDTTVNTLMADTLVLSNISDGNSTLDYNIALDGKGLESNISVKLVPSAKAAVKASKGNPATEGGVSFRGFGGPDAFGYEWIDSDENGGPAYEWTDISSTGTKVTNWQATGTYSAEDEGFAGPFDLGFAFDYYDTDFTEVYFGTNGFISFEQISGSTFSNTQLPFNSAPNAMIAACWDDLKKGVGDVYYQQFANKFVIQYTNWEKYFGSSSLTFQIILYKNGKIKINYESMTGELNGCTVGIEDAAGSVGLQVVKDAAYITNGLAVEFSAAPDWVVMEEAEGTIYNGNAVEMIIDFNTTDLETGVHSTNIIITSNDLLNSPKHVPVTISVGTQGLVSSSITYSEGWNLLSVPVTVGDMSAASLFPDASGTAYGFAGNYFVASDLENGAGYWLKFDQGNTSLISGNKVTAPVEVNEQWNIVGFYDEPVTAANIVSIPADIVSSVFYGYNNGYSIADVLEPGKAYWVKTTAQGTLTPGTPSKGNSKVDLTELAGITISSEKGSSTLYLGYDGNVNKFVMPPLPPAGSFDARFANNSLISADITETVKLQSDAAITVTALNQDLRINGTVVMAGESLNLQKGTSEFSVSSVSVPSVYALQQNFPNPFNPSTTLNFALPVDAKVTITLYNALGQKVTDIVNGNFAAGQQFVRFNASDLASGLYIYQIAAFGADGSQFSATKKMMLMK